MAPTANFYLLANIIAQMIVTSFVYLYAYWRPFGISLNTKIGPHDLLAWSIYKIPNTYSIILGTICVAFCIIALLTKSKTGRKPLEGIRTFLDSNELKVIFIILIGLAGYFFVYLKIIYVVVLIFIPFFIIHINYALFKKKPESLFAQIALVLWWCIPITAAVQGENRAKQLLNNEFYQAISIEYIRDFKQDLDFKEVKLIGTLGEYAYVLSPDNKDKFQIHSSQIPIIKVEVRREQVKSKESKKENK